MRYALALLALLAATTAQAKTIEIKMLNMSKEGPMAFEPGFVKAEKGDTIKFVPTDKAHSVQSVAIPGGAKAWNGKPDEAVTVKLDKEGVYLYQCQPHAAMAMAGVIQVGKPSNIDAIKKDAEKLTGSFVMNKDRVKKYLDLVK